MRAWVLGGILLLAGVAAAALLEATTTSSGSSAVTSVRGCGGGAYGVGSADFERAADGSFTMAFHDGDIIPVTIPVGEYRVALEAEGGWIRPVENLMMPQQPAQTYYLGGCAEALTTERYRALGEGALRVSYWMLGDAPKPACSATSLLFQPPSSILGEHLVAAGERFGVRIPSGAFALTLRSDDTRFRDAGEAPWRREVSLSGCAERDEVRTFVAESAGRVVVLGRA